MEQVLNGGDADVAAPASTAPEAPVSEPLPPAPGASLVLMAASPTPALTGGEVADGPLPPLQGHVGVELYTLPMSDEEIIGRYVQGILTSRGDWLQAVLDRSLVYRDVISQAIKEKGLPRELEYLPAVESGFQVRALSPRGAAGLWQLMRNTASPYGLRMDQWVDERRDFWKATDASLDKLEENYSFLGDWYLALAAYNCGLGKMSALVHRYPGNDFWALRRKGVLPRETAAFVPQFLALTRILRLSRPLRAFHRLGIGLAVAAHPRGQVRGPAHPRARIGGAVECSHGGQPGAQLPHDPSGILRIPAEGARAVR